ncbi:MAG: hypothetical protein LC795_08660 [Acidobacteria bacterium]|nr:hypothetical protein [Acidobacteriota bacterium]
MPRSAPFGTGKAARSGRTCGLAVTRAACEGTSVSANCGWRRRIPSYEAKKKTRLVRTGPPSVAPKSCWRMAGRVSPRLLANQSLASRPPPRKYSKAEPCSSFEPARVAMATCAPGVRPNSGA